MADQLSETIKIREQLALVKSELKTTRAEVLSVEAELAAAKDAELEALTRAELMETELQMEKQKTDELLRRVSELNEAILQARMAAIEEEKEKCAVLSEKEAEIELVKTVAVEAEEGLEEMRKELQVMQDLENQLMAKSEIIDLLKVEIQQANEIHSLSEEAASGAISQVKQLKSDLELQERKNMDQSGYIELLEMEVNKLKKDLKNAKEEVHCLNSDAVSIMRGELEKAKTEMEEIRERETEARIEIAMLKSELHKGRSKSQVPQNAESEGEDGRDDTDACIMMSKEEYRALIEKAGKANQAPVAVPEKGHELELEKLKKELEIASVRMGELRTRAEQAASRADAAEKGKAGVEDQVRKWREQRERRKAALAALREESFPFPKESSGFFEYDDQEEAGAAGGGTKTYLPLAKVLNMKF